jgi:membrane protein involved in colicin uptake
MNARERIHRLAADTDRQAGEIRRLAALTLTQEQEAARLTQALAASEQRERECRALAARLEHDNTGIQRNLRAEADRLGEALRRAGEESRRLGEENRDLGEQNRRLSEHEAALNLLPRILRHYLHSRIVRAHR